MFQKRHLVCPHDFSRGFPVMENPHPPLLKAGAFWPIRIVR